MLLLNKYLKTYILLAYVFLNKNTYAQNLVQNGDFEYYTNIDCTYGGFDNGSPPYNHVLNAWYGYQSPDYFNSICSSLGWYNMPNSYFGYSNSKSGSAYIGIATYLRGSYLKEYIYQHLSQSLQSGKIYCLSFFVSKADRFSYSIHSIGAFFSVNTPTLANCCEINATPQVVNQNGFITDTTSWVQIEDCFTANGGEQYLTIGNFTPNANTDTLNVGTNNQVVNGEAEAYYYIDNITLVEDLSMDINDLSPENSFKIYPNPSDGIFEITTSSQEEYTVQITNAIGQMVQVINLQKGKTAIDLSQEKEGIYFYRILLKDNLIKTDKIVIIK